MTLSSVRRSPFARFDETAPRLLRSQVHDESPDGGAFDEGADRHPGWALEHSGAAGSAHFGVEMAPANTARRRALMGRGLAAEYVQCPGHSVVEYRFRAPMNLLVAYEQGECRDGETFVEGLPRSTLRSFARKLTFVPAGHEYRARYEPRATHNLIHFYFDHARLQNPSQLRRTPEPLVPRLFFEDSALWPPILKLKGVIENPASDDQSYFDALGMVLILEIARLNRGKRGIEPPARGGLAAWQQRIVAGYIEQHLAEGIRLATLAELARLSPNHFCRSFKRSFGKPPHRYQLDLRIERAKRLLARRAGSITDVALTIGFSDSSAFATAFRKATGMTPTAYHRR